MFCALLFVLNEGKFIRYALEGYLSSPLVEKIIVVEGCVKLNKAAGSDDGLSTDNTAKVVANVSKGDKSKRIVFEQYGWAEGKSELQNRCMELAEKHAPNAKYFILAGGDEVYAAADLERLKKEIERLGNPDIPLYEFVHLWKRPDWRAKGSTWDWWMHRCYRNHGPGMRFGFHAGPPMKPDGSKLKDGVKVRGVKVFHYSAMKDKKDILDRIGFYKLRDRKGRDTWTDWSPGKPTQWTHGGGTAEPYTGPHPPVIADVVWDLVPGLPKPRVAIYLTPFAGEQEIVKPFITHLARLCYLTVFSLRDPGWKGVKFREVNDLESQVKKSDWLVTASRSVILAPVGKQNVIFAFAAPKRHLNLSGYRVVCLDEGVGSKWSGKARVVDNPAKLLLGIEEMPVVVGGGPARPISHSSPAIFSTAQVGKNGTPGKLGKSGKVGVANTRPFVVVWEFTNPLKEQMSPKLGHLGYGVKTANGRKVSGMRHVVGIPTLPPDGPFRAEITIPVSNLRPGEYIIEFDFRYKNKWGRNRGVEPLRILIHVDKYGKIWVR